MFTSVKLFDGSIVTPNVEEAELVLQNWPDLNPEQHAAPWAIARSIEACKRVYARARKSEPRVLEQAYKLVTWAYLDGAQNAFTHIGESTTRTWIREDADIVSATKAWSMVGVQLHVGAPCQTLSRRVSELEGA